MPGHYGSHSHSNKSTTTGGGNTNRERGIQRNQRTGRSSTILTGAEGLEDDSSVVSKKELLGG